MAKRGNPALEFAAEVQALRRQIEEVAAERAALDRALVPKAEALARVDHYVDTLSQAGAVPVTGFVGQRAAFPPLLRDTATDGTAGPARVSLQPVARLLAWLDPDALRKRLRAEVEAAYRDGPEAMAAVDRTVLARTLSDRLLVLEIAEERLIREAEAAGIIINRRMDADARALVAE